MAFPPLFVSCSDIRKTQISIRSPKRFVHSFNNKKFYFNFYKCTIIVENVTPCNFDSIISCFSSSSNFEIEFIVPTLHLEVKNIFNNITKTSHFYSNLTLICSSFPFYFFLSKIKIVNKEVIFFFHLFSSKEVE